MQLHELKPRHKSKVEKRIGRGGKRGTTSGRGQKGQKSRSGRKLRPAERDLIQRLPKFRGFKFKPLASKAVVLNLIDLERKTKGDMINLKTLKESGLIRQRNNRVKILGSGEMHRPIIVQGLSVSESARKKIEAAGGKIINHKA